MGLFSRLIRAAAAAFPVLAAGCSPAPLQSEAMVEVTPLNTYGTVYSGVLLRLAGVSTIGVENAVDCYRIVYPSVDEHGKPIKLSGLLALPRDVSPRGLVSYQHGTTSSRQDVPSNLNTEGLAAAIVFAGNGYAAIAPDYDGMGVSERAHPYYVAERTARAVVDMIHAVRKLKGVTQSAPLFIGFSEGGSASFAAHRAMEAAGEEVRGTASIAGAFHLRTISIPHTLKGLSPQASTYLALWVRGYARHYSHPLDTVFTADYAKSVPPLFDVAHTPEEVRAALPRDPRKLFRPEVVAAIEGKGQHWLVDALAENEMSEWTPKAPVRLYYGTQDVDVPPAEATITAKEMAARGSDIKAISVGAVDHNGSILAAAPQIFAWFKTL